MPLLRYLALCLLLATAAAAVSGNGDADISIPRACATPEASKYPFCEPGRSIDERVEDLLGRLKLEEKPALLIARMSPDGGVDRLGLPEYNWGTNCMHGVESWCGKVMTGKDDNNDGVEDHYLICPSSFPSPNSLGSSFNMSLVQDVASLVSG